MRLLQKIWSKIRLQRILKQHKSVAQLWQPLIREYFDGKLEKYTFSCKAQLDTEKIIWQYWGQGIDENLPEVVKICFESVDKYKDDYTVIRLSDDTISDYIDLPDFVLHHLQNNPNFSRTFLSDILRLALLKTYGGVWLDATILLTQRLPESFTQMDYFMFQRSADETHKAHWENAFAYYYGWHKQFKVNLLNSIIFAKKENYVISVLLDLLLHHWKQKDKAEEYFFFQILYNELITDKLRQYQCPVVNDCIPHLLQTKINGNYPYLSFDEVFELTGIHKLTYFSEEKMKKLVSLLNSTH